MTSMKKRPELNNVLTTHDKAYDLSISDEVDLSEVLDELIRTYEKPDTIVNFLKMHDDDFDDIIAHSLNYMRIFMLDFIVRCSNDSIDYIVKKLKKIDITVAMSCCWQVLSLYSDANSYAKMMFKRECAILQTGTSFRHPYSHLCTPEVKDIDLMLFEVIAKGGRAHEIAAAINSLDIKMWKSFMIDMRKSLFFMQLIQSDILEMLDEDHLRVLLLNTDIYMREIMMQWLNADLSIAYKVFICKRICFVNGTIYSEIANASWSKIKKRFCKSWFKRYYDENDPVMADSFEEMMLKMTLDGHFSKREVAYALLQMGRIDFLVDWMKFDAADLDKALKICDVMKLADAEMEAKKHNKRAAKKL